MGRFRIYHVNAADDTLITTYLFDTPEATTNDIPGYNVSNTGSYEGAGNAIVSGYSAITKVPTLNMPFLNLDDNDLEEEGYVFKKSINWRNFHVGDKLYLGRWDHSHSYLQVITVDKSLSFQRKDWWVNFNYCCYDGTIAYSNVGITSRWIESRGSWEFEFLPWLWDWNSPNNWNINGGHFWKDLGQYGAYRVGNYTAASTAIAQKFWQKVPIIDTGNPFAPGGTSVPDDTIDNPGNFSEDSQDLDEENLPDEATTGAVGSGFATIFSPSKSQLTHLADVMWGNDIVSFLQNQVENIKDMFVSLGIVPFAVTKGSTRKVMWLGIVDTAIWLDTAANQFYEFDMGSINMATSEYVYSSKSALDYSPFSKLGIYLPFIGYQELDIDECRDSIIGLKYKIDILSGSCVAQISLNGNPVYQFAGNCMTQIPLTGQDAQTLFTNAVNVGIAAAGARSAGAVASAGDAATDAMADSGKLSADGAEAQHAQHSAKVSNARGNLASATANGMMGMKPSYSKAGAISASNSLLALKQPFLFLTTPRQCIPENYQRYCGFPCNITGKLNEFSGYTVVEDIRLNGLVATSSEVEEIYSLLKSGVII